MSRRLEDPSESPTPVASPAAAAPAGPPLLPFEKQMTGLEKQMHQGLEAAKVAGEKLMKEVESVAGGIMPCVSPRSQRPPARPSASPAPPAPTAPAAPIGVSSRIHEEKRKMDEVEQALTGAANEFLRAGPASTADPVAFFATYFKSKSSATAELRGEDDGRTIEIEEAINAALRTVFRDGAADPIRSGPSQT